MIRVTLVIEQEANGEGVSMVSRGAVCAAHTRGESEFLEFLLVQLYEICRRRSTAGPGQNRLTIVRSKSRESA